MRQASTIAYARFAKVCRNTTLLDEHGVWLSSNDVHAAKSLIGEAWTKCCSTMPTISTARTFSISAGKSWIRTLPPRACLE